MLPAGWAENASDEGQQGLQAAFDVVSGPGPEAVNISGDTIKTTMSPHDVAASMVTQPGAGTVVAKGDCQIAGGDAAYFKSTISATVFPGITKSGAGYTILIGHGGTVVYLVVILPATLGDQAIPDVKSILGSWTWDPA